MAENDLRLKRAQAQGFTSNIFTSPLGDPGYSSKVNIGGR